MIPLPQLALMAIWVLCLHSVYVDGCKARPQAACFVMIDGRRVPVYGALVDAVKG
jgi:hypothetical protein